MASSRPNVPIIDERDLGVKPPSIMMTVSGNQLVTGTMTYIPPDITWGNIEVWRGNIGTVTEEQQRRLDATDEDTR